MRQSTWRTAARTWAASDLMPGREASLPGRSTNSIVVGVFLRGSKISKSRSRRGSGTGTVARVASRA